MACKFCGKVLYDGDEHCWNCGRHQTEDKVVEVTEESVALGLAQEAQETVQQAAQQAVGQEPADPHIVSE